MKWWKVLLAWLDRRRGREVEHVAVPDFLEVQENELRQLLKIEELKRKVLEAKSATLKAEHEAGQRQIP